MKSTPKSLGIGRIQNLNILLLRPENLNSSGIWGFRHMTENRNGADIVPKSYTEWGKSYITVDQYWVDLQVYEAGSDKWIDKAAKMIVRDQKIDLIGV